jgi:superfamily II DNA/RNA helicase
MFSATMPRAIAEFAAQMLRDPVKIAVAPAAATADRVAQRIIRVDRSAKPAILIDVLRRETIDRCLVFTRTKHGADKVVRNLRNAGIAADAIHGNKSQGQRERVLAAFRKGEVRTLVATDIAARGIDVDGISHVVNYDVPNVPETYVHRIGRTARAGAEGIAISLCDSEEMEFLRDIEKLIRVSIPMSDRRADQRRPDHGSAERRSGERRSGERRSGERRSGERRSGERGSAEHESTEHGSARHFPAQANVKAGERHWRHNGQARKQDRHHPPNRSSSSGIDSVAFLNRNRSSQHDGGRHTQRRSGYPKGS